MEAKLLNSSAVHIKWQPPPQHSIHGVLQGYKVVLKNNITSKTHNITTDINPKLILTTLTPGVTYTVCVAGLTSAGVGPFSSWATLRLDPTSRLLDQHQQRQPIGTDLHPGDFITETWFVALLISMVSVMVLLFGAMFFVRRRQLLSKKTMTPSRSNGAVLTTPLALKHEAPLWLDKDPLPDYATTLPEYAKLNTEYNSLNGQLPGHSSHPKEYSRPDRLEYNRINPDKEYARKDLSLEGVTKTYVPTNQIGHKDYNNMQVQDYASPNIGPEERGQLADYAEVEATAGAVGVPNQEPSSPEPYATTTLVTGSRRHGNSLASRKSFV